MEPPVGPYILMLSPETLYGIRWYGLFIVTGIMLGAAVAAFMARQAGEDPEKIWDSLWYAVIPAVIGARLYHVFSTPAGGQIGWPYYQQHPEEIFYLWKGGLGIIGAILGGALGLGIYARINHLRPLRWLDFGVPGLAIGQAMGRWGNFMNRELYGPPTTLPWGLRIPQEYRIIPYTDMEKYPLTTLFQPTFLYESLATLALCIGLIVISVQFSKKLKEGDLLLFYLIGYFAIRFGIEYLRPDAWVIGQLAAAQLFALGFIALAGLALLIRHWPTRSKVTPA